jgi:transcriptional regulator with XRE-family HTH domain
MTKYRKANIKLSQEVIDHFALLGTDRDRNAYMKALRERGWTLESVAECTNLTRERVRQIAAGIPMSEAFRVAASGYPIPEPPNFEEKVPASDKYIEPTSETLTRLLELQPFAQQVRSYGSRYRKEAEEYSWLVNYAYTVEGVTLYRLAKRLGVTHGALRFRLARYGYKKPVNALSAAYTPILEENRVHLDMKTMPGYRDRKEENDEV